MSVNHVGGKVILFRVHRKESELVDGRSVFCREVQGILIGGTKPCASVAFLLRRPRAPKTQH
jgi:hypothetical protein